MISAGLFTISGEAGFKSQLTIHNSQMSDVAKIAIAPSSKTHDYEESVRRAGGEPVVIRPR